MIIIFVLDNLSILAIAYFSCMIILVYLFMSMQVDYAEMLEKAE